MPDILGQMTAAQLRMLPERADGGALEAVRTMLELGWPREITAPGMPPRSISPSTAVT